VAGAGLVATTGSSSGTINLNWNSPADNTPSGPARSDYYVVKYSTSNDITDNASFDSATEFHQIMPTAQAALPGNPESLMITGLTPGTTYWISVKACDKYDSFLPKPGDPVSYNTNTDSCSSFGGTVSAEAYNPPSPPVYIPPTPPVPPTPPTPPTPPIVHQNTVQCFYRKWCCQHRSKAGRFKHHK